MMNLDLCLCFSRLLSYPNAQLKPLAADCYRQLQQTDPDAAVIFAAFINFLEQWELPRIEELYTSAFDLQALSFPYVGYQLCGESQARTLFLMKLQEIYKQHDFSSEGELPDHLSVMLRFIGTVADPQGNREIIDDALLPALEKIIEGIENQQHPYRQLLMALQAYLTNLVATVAMELPENTRQKELSHG
jgi:nitrate reductase delta subunit